MSKSGKNVTPPEMGLELRTKMLKLCDAALCEVIHLSKPSVVKTVQFELHTERNNILEKLRKTVFG